MKYIFCALIGLFLFASCENSSAKSDAVLSAVFNNFNDVTSSKELNKKQTKSKLNELLGEDKRIAYGDLLNADDIEAKWLKLDLGDEYGVLVIKKGCKLIFVGDDNSIFSFDDTGGSGSTGEEGQEEEEPEPGTTDGGTVNVTCCTNPKVCIVNCVPGSCDEACSECLCECTEDGEGENDEIFDFMSY